MASSKTDAAGTSPYAIEMTPDTSLQFVLTRGVGQGSDASTPKCTMTLWHPGGINEHLAFKVKTTQPRRYLVRPNQGLIAPSGTETVSIILVDKDKQALLQSYDRLGQSALDHSKDKFLVQSTAVTHEFVETYGSKPSEGNKANKELAEALTSMWNAAGSSPTPVINKKLHVKHVVLESTTPHGATKDGDRSMPTLPPAPAMENMSAEQMLVEVSNLRRKYDELVAFSVNLTAGRDMLNNTLEQTKRDLNREMALRASAENSAGIKGRGKTAVSNRGNNGFSLSFVQVLIVALACFVMGVKTALKGEESVILNLPLLSKLFGV
eukprot:CAMPEP_0195522318 /NCGR_PEP_ID=MMETSP0794_2-20130614/20383_1 /TAXON_ID=515487 /ORGANISM="Stephanopyxis turris, Strain CCMP 815" /LENGTH=322 /DNA_ID=CAMNT_0040652047 /DNA_START=125 /DNA_END=1093 /DNA_ORIENTATION=-